MKVKDLLALLAQADQELDVAVLTSTSEYWGSIYGVATKACVDEDCQVDGPKRAGKPAFLITVY